jgi:hypothetical protein
MGWFGRKPKDDPSAVIGKLRAKALAVTAAELSIEPTAERPHVWGLLMETGYPDAASTLVVFADGTTSLYFSGGGGIIGAGQHDSVRQAAERLLSAAEPLRGEFRPASDTGLPTDGQVRILLRTFTGTMAATATEHELGARTHRLSPLFFAAHGVITAIRESTPDDNE